MLSSISTKPLTMQRLLAPRLAGRYRAHRRHLHAQQLAARVVVTNCADGWPRRAAALLHALSSACATSLRSNTA
jgi:hypothetical protein